MIQQTDLSIPAQNGVGVRAWLSEPFYFSRCNYLLAPPTQALINPDKSVLEKYMRWFPVSLVGPTHTGKTSWIYGVYWTWYKNHPRQKSLLSTALDFHRDFRNAQLTRTFSDFEERFRNLRLLALTDINQLLQYPETQQELVYILDILEEKETPVLFSVNEDDQSEGWNSKLIKRMQSGLLIKTQMPDDDLCRAFALELLRNLIFPPEYADFIADWVVARGHLSLTAIKGELSRLDLGYRQAFSEPELLKNGLTAELLSEWASLTTPNSEPLKIHDIAKLAVKEFGITLAELKSASRKKTSVLTRGAVVYLGRKLGNFTLEQLANYLGGRNHSTIIHTLKAFSLKVESDNQLKPVIQRLERALR